MKSFEEVKEPDKPILSNLQLLSGKNIPDIKKLETFSEDDFERIIEQWAFGYLKDIYGQVYRNGGAGDKGRDVICFYKNDPQQSDIYQCKHYNDSITPSVIAVEIGKLLYYTFNNDYSVPFNYFIVSSKGCGTKLRDYLTKPEEFKKFIKEKWDDYCKDKITKTLKITLDKDLKEYIDKFDFSIIKEITPLELIDSLKKTCYYFEWFGIQQLERPQVIKPTDEIQDNELTYIRKLLDAYESKIQTKLSHHNELNSAYTGHFRHQRECFYSAESLEKFSRDYLPPTELFKNLQKQIVDPVRSTILITEYSDGLLCLNEAIKLASTIQIGNNSLEKFVMSADRNGILHQVANDETEFKWVKTNE